MAITYDENIYVMREVSNGRPTYTLEDKNGGKGYLIEIHKTLVTAPKEKVNIVIKGSNRIFARIKDERTDHPDGKRINIVFENNEEVAFGDLAVVDGTNVEVKNNKGYCSLIHPNSTIKVRNFKFSDNSDLKVKVDFLDRADKGMLFLKNFSATNCIQKFYAPTARDNDKIGVAMYSPASNWCDKAVNINRLYIDYSGEDRSDIGEESTICTTFTHSTIDTLFEIQDIRLARDAKIMFGEIKTLVLNNVELEQNAIIDASNDSINKIATFQGYNGKEGSAFNISSQGANGEKVININVENVALEKYADFSIPATASKVLIKDVKSLDTKRNFSEKRSSKDSGHFSVDSLRIEGVDKLNLVGKILFNNIRETVLRDCEKVDIRVKNKYSMYANHKILLDAVGCKEIYLDFKEAETHSIEAGIIAKNSSVRIEKTQIDKRLTIKAQDSDVSVKNSKLLEELNIDNDAILDNVVIEKGVHGLFEKSEIRNCEFLAAKGNVDSYFNIKNSNMDSVTLGGDDLGNEEERSITHALIADSDIKNSKISSNANISSSLIESAVTENECIAHGVSFFGDGETVYEGVLPDMTPVAKKPTQKREVADSGLKQDREVEL